MNVYTVHEPPDAPVDSIDRAERLKFIGDRFSPVATAFGPFWLLANRLWFGFAMYAVAIALIVLVLLVLGLGPRWISLMAGALNLIVGFEAASLQRLALERRGWQTIGTVSGRNIEECERRFLEGWLPNQRVTPASRTPAGTGVNAFLDVADGTAEGRLGRAPGSGWLSWRTRRGTA